MRRALGPLLMGLILFAVGKAQAGWVGGLAAGLCAAFLAFFMGAQVRARAMRKAPEAPAMQLGETPLLHGPVTVVERGGARECWAYLSDRSLSLLPSDGGDGQTLLLSNVKELRPPRRRWIGSGPLGLVVEGQLWQLKVPDIERWLAALKAALHEKA
jgi:hypothetical protein